MWQALLLAHGILAAAALGMVTHQIAGLFLRASAGPFARSYSSVRPAIFTNAVVVTLAANFLLGIIIYTRYRYTARPSLEDSGLQRYVGAFELKEHLEAVTLFSLPAYWAAWRSADAGRGSFARTALTIFLCMATWIAFLVGHLVNNARGI